SRAVLPGNLQAGAAAATATHRRVGNRKTGAPSRDDRGLVPACPSRPGGIQCGRDHVDDRLCCRGVAPSAGVERHGLLEHFSWLSIVPGVNRLPDHIAGAALIAVLLVALAVVARRQLVAAPDAVIPDASLTARNALEIFVEWFAALADGVIGPGGRRYAH